MKRSGVARLLLLATALAAPPGAVATAADLWRWIDAGGVPRYTPDPDRVPAARRATLERVEPGMAAAPQREPAVAQPPAIFAPPGDPALAADPFNEPERAREIHGEVVEGEVIEGEIHGETGEGEVVVEIPTPSSAPSPLGSQAPSGAAEPPRSVDSAPGPPAARQPAPAVAEPRPAPVAAVRAEPAVAAPTAPPGPPEFQGEVVVEFPAAELPAPAAGPPAPLAPDRAARRAELLAAIAHDEEALKDHVSSGSDTQLAASPELREIAERLPALQAELRALEAPSAAP